MNALTILKREPVFLADMDEKQTPEIEPNLLAQAKQFLGYELPKPATAPKQPLAHALVVMGLKPLSTKTVEKFTRKIITHHKKKEWRRDKGFHLGIVFVLAALSILLFLIATAIGGVLSSIASYPQMSHTLTIYNWGILSFLFVSISGIICIAWGSGRRPAKWKHMNLHEYPRPIPEFALATAIEVAQRCPTTTFSVLELEIADIPKDPFLFAELGEEKYYLEVWNEPNFKATRPV